MSASLANSWVRLSPITAEDLAEIATAIAQSARLHGKWVAPACDKGALAAWAARLGKPDYAGFLARRIDDNSVVGIFNISQICRGLFHSAYLGYYALMPNGGRGYMRAAMPLLLEAAFRQLRLHRLEANIQPSNTASLALVKRFGFRLEGFSPRYLKIAGHWRDHERWAILAEEWRTLKRHYHVPEPERS